MILEEFRNALHLTEDKMNFGLSYVSGEAASHKIVEHEFILIDMPAGG